MNYALSAFTWFCLGFTFAQLVDMCVMAVEALRMKKKMES